MLSYNFGMGLADYNAREKHWVSPRLVFVYLNDLAKSHGESFVRTNKKLFEARTVAIVLLGIHKLTGLHFFLQVPKDIDHQADVVTMHLTEHDDKPVQAQIQDVQVVEYGENSIESLGDFVLSKKMNPRTSGKAYDDKTIIICHITKKNLVVDHYRLHKQIEVFAPRPELYLLGGIPGRKVGEHRLRRIWPQLDQAVEFNIFDEAINYPKPDSLKLSLGASKKITLNGNGGPLPDKYEVFELEKKINKID